MTDFYSLVHKVLLPSRSRTNFPYIGRFLDRAWRFSEKHARRPIATKIHGFPVKINFGYTYPQNARRFSQLNNPLLELVNLTFLSLGRPLTVVDVGAAIGDTVLLLKANCDPAIDTFICIDGDDEFAKYLTINLSRFANIEIISETLSESGADSPHLVRIHGGTASPQGKDLKSSKTLDDLFKNRETIIDVIKIDVDGFDGRVLSGAQELLKSNKPSVIFEWHPILYEATRSSLDQPFQTLAKCGYNRFIWFNKFGEFSHFSNAGQEFDSDLAQVCLRGNFQYDWHYDVVALHESSLVSPIELAECDFARSCTSRY